MVFVAALLAAPAGAGDVVFGSFMLQTAQSTAGERCAAISLVDLGNGKFHLTAARVSEDGKAVHQDGIFAFDGLDHPDGAGGSLAFSRIDEARYVVVAKGTVHATAMRTLGSDGATMTEIADGTDDGDAFHAARVYARRAGTCD